MIAKFKYVEKDDKFNQLIESVVAGSLSAIVHYTKLKEPDLCVGSGIYITVGNKDYDIDKCHSLEMKSDKFHINIRKNQNLSYCVEVFDCAASSIIFSSMTLTAEELPKELADYIC